MKFGIVTDSSCDLPESYTAQEEVTVVSFYVSFDGENYLKEGKDCLLYTSSISRYKIERMAVWITNTWQIQEKFRNM